MTCVELEDLLKASGDARVGLIGDLCLDVYWTADMKKSSLSRETPHFPLPVTQERYTPGGAGNVACNMIALQPKKLMVLGVVGDDWRGKLLLEALADQGVDTSYVLQVPGWVTNTYIKPLRTGISDVIYEDPRLDFENYGPLPEAAQEQLLMLLDQLARQVDVLCVSDQMEFGCITPVVREKLCQLGTQGLTVIVDSRSRAGAYKNVILKPNEVEAACMLQQRLDTLEDAQRLARVLSERTGKPGVITLGHRGSVLCADGQTIHCPACPVEPPVDFCGAGDSFLSGLGVFMAAGADLRQAAEAATLCSAVTVKKLNTTGTATPGELQQAYKKYCIKDEEC